MQYKYRYLLVKSFRTELYNLEIFESIWKFWFKSHEICAKIKNFCCAFLMSFIHHQSPLITIIDHSSSSRSSLARLPLETLPLSLACPATGAAMAMAIHGPSPPRPLVSHGRVSQADSQYNQSHDTVTQSVTRLIRLRTYRTQHSRSHGRGTPTTFQLISLNWLLIR